MMNEVLEELRAARSRIVNANVWWHTITGRHDDVELKMREIEKEIRNLHEQIKNEGCGEE